MKKIICVLCMLLLTAGLIGCGHQEKAEMNVLVLSGPTGVGAVNLWKNSEENKTVNTYHFTLASANDEVVAAIANGNADIAAVATNQAAALYNKTGGKITVLAVNTAGVLSMLTKGKDIKTIADLKGKTIYLPGKGANPEYILRYVLQSNGIDPDLDVQLEFVADGNELPGVWGKDPEAVIMAPQPVATVIAMKIPETKKVFDMAEEWNKVSKDSALMMGCVIARNDFLNEHPEAVQTFLKEYETSISTAKNDPKSTGALCAEYGIVPKADIAEKALPECGLTFVTGNEMKLKLSGYLKIMFDADPKSVGGKLPEDGFYYSGQ